MFAMLPVGWEGRSSVMSISGEEQFDTRRVIREPSAAVPDVNPEGELHLARQPTFGLLAAIACD